MGDISRTYYRSKEEEDHWKKNRDPIKILGDWLISEKISSSDDLKKTIKEIETQAETAVQYALNAKYPDEAEVDMHVYLEKA